MPDAKRPYATALEALIEAIAPQWVATQPELEWMAKDIIEMLAAGGYTLTRLPDDLWARQHREAHAAWLAEQSETAAKPRSVAPENTDPEVQP
jgi:hypothetical protein